jgi:hypothetical protein
MPQPDEIHHQIPVFRLDEFPMYLHMDWISGSEGHRDVEFHATTAAGLGGADIVIQFHHEGEEAVYKINMKDVIKSLLPRVVQLENWGDPPKSAYKEAGSPESIQSCLVLVKDEIPGVIPTTEEIAGWSQETIKEVLEWTLAVQIEASEFEESISVPETPSILTDEEDQ